MLTFLLFNEQISNIFGIDFIKNNLAHAPAVVAHSAIAHAPIGYHAPLGLGGYHGGLGYGAATYGGYGGNYSIQI